MLGQHLRHDAVDSYARRGCSAAVSAHPAVHCETVWVNPLMTVFDYISPELSPPCALNSVKLCAFPAVHACTIHIIFLRVVGSQLQMSCFLLSHYLSFLNLCTPGGTTTACWKFQMAICNGPGQTSIQAQCDTIPRAGLTPAHQVNVNTQGLPGALTALVHSRT